MKSSMLNGTVFDYSEDIVYFNGIFSLNTSLPFFVFIGISILTALSIISCLCSFGSSDLSHQEIWYGRKEGPAWENYVKQTNRKTNKRCFIHYTWLIICIYLLFMTWASHFYYKGSKDYLGFSDQSIYDNHGSCSEDPNLLCCVYYDNCIQGASGELGKMDADTYVISALRSEWPRSGRMGDKITCPDISWIIYQRDKMLNLYYSWSGEYSCKNSPYGCCSVKSMCDSYIREGYNYDLYLRNERYFYPLDRGKMRTLVAKEDPEGSNCNNESIPGILQSYDLELSKNEIHENNNYIINHMKIATSIIMIYLGLSIIIIHLLCRVNHYDTVSNNIIESESQDDTNYP